MFIAKADSATSHHFFALRDEKTLNYIKFDKNPTTAILPNTYSITSIKEGY